jgi:hypothetical protein
VVTAEVEPLVLNFVAAVHIVKYFLQLRIRLGALSLLGGGD